MPTRISERQLQSWQSEKWDSHLERVRLVEEDEPVWFAHSAALRIFGDGVDFETITRTLGVEPTHTHRKGEMQGKRSKPWPHDMWSHEAQVEESRPLDQHITALWDVLRPHMPYLYELKRSLKVDVFCGYRSNSGTAGIDVDHRCLGLFIELEVPFALSIIV